MESFNIKFQLSFRAWEQKNLGATPIGLIYKTRPHFSGEPLPPSTSRSDDLRLRLFLIDPVYSHKTQETNVTMASQGLQILGVMLAMIGWLGSIITCAMPMWRVTAFIGANIVTAQVIWEGLWMTCVVQSTGQMQCKVYDSMLALSSDLQAARAMTIISIIVGIFGVLMAIMGGKCTNCLEDESAKARACIVSGVIFIMAAVLVLVPVSWSAHTLIRDFYNPLIIAAQQRELGAALYIGWGTAVLLLLGGGLLCWNCPPRDHQAYGAAQYAPARSKASGDYV
ncbi:hypothetical protein AALO_G00027370 [Alosa alosa]|uniref:Claudin n=1 Tax=Alosa alosa TaxID=278164 RepID=A0AAV6HAU8_9TELE|nr:hypothetical protein AALO_G00027370 [Alosa alosa]